jgi:hypothetical protein
VAAVIVAAKPYLEETSREHHQTILKVIVFSLDKVSAGFSSTFNSLALIKT